MASKEYYTFLEQLKKRVAPKDLTREQLRTGFEKFLSAFPPEPETCFDSFSIDSIPACWVKAPGVNQKKVLLFFHGGGFNAGSITSHGDLIGRISRASQASVLAIGYRLAPEHPFPAALEDALTSYRYLLDQFDPSSIGLVGSSAGGGLVLSLCLKLKEQNLTQPALAVCICPMLDLSFSSDSIQRNQDKDWVKMDRILLSTSDYCQGQDPKQPLISPLFGDFEGLPPLLIQVGSHEILCDEAILACEKAQACDVLVTLEKWPEMVHCWHLFASIIPEGQKAIDHIGKFVKKHLKDH